MLDSQNTVEMKKLVLFITVLVGLASHPLTAAEGGVAIVDLDAVAKELGVLDFIAVTLENRKVELDAELGKVQKNLQEQLNRTVKLVGDNPNDEQKKQVAITRREMEIQFQQARGRASQVIQAEKLKLINDFRKELKPHALEAAKKKKLYVVLNMVMPPVYAYDTSVDITQDVIVAAKKAGLEKKAPARKKQP